MTAGQGFIDGKTRNVAGRLGFLGMARCGKVWLGKGDKK